MSEVGQTRYFGRRPTTSGFPPETDMPLKCHKRTKDLLRSYFGLRGNGINPSRFGILTLGSDCASITSFDPTIPLRLRI